MGLGNADAQRKINISPQCRRLSRGTLGICLFSAGLCIEKMSIFPKRKKWEQGEAEWQR